MTETAIEHRVTLEPYAGSVTRVAKPWGFELIYAVTETYCGKLLVVNSGHALSLQYHEHKDETIYLDEGLAEIEIGPPGGPLGREIVRPGRAFRIEPGTVHRLRAITDCTFLEVSTPHLDDVVRLEDAYGRTGTVEK
jgi:mannose-6-phosphate isomerase-like protein (cupin superfamily)